MKQKRIMLGTVEDAKDFVASRNEMRIRYRCFYNRVMIDAKSLLGVMSLDLTRVLTVEYSGENKEFEAFLDRTAAKAVTVAKKFAYN